MKHAFFERATWGLVGWFAAVIFVSIAASFYISWVGAAMLFFLAAAAAIFVVRPVWGVWALAAVAPMSGLVISFSREPSLARLPYIGGIEAPVVDFLAIMLLVVAPLVLLLNPKQISLSRVRTHAGWFALWFAAAALAVYFGDQIYFGTSVKAFLRPYLFTYVAFVLPVLFFIRTRTEAIIAARAYEIVCALGALMGVASLFVVNAVGFPRIEPFSIFGYAPFGTNHNVLAESLTAIVPFAVWYAAGQKTRAAKIVWGALAVLIALVCIGTLSRAAWLVLALQAVLWLWYVGKKFSRRHIAAVVVAALLATFFFWIQNTKVADSSDATRADLTGISLLYFSRAPWTGQGPGTFVPLVEETTAFRMDYGDALDAHGVLQKTLTETGMFGTIAFVVLLIAIGRTLWIRRHDSFYFMWFVTFVSLWVYQLFNTSYFAGKVWVLIGLMLASLFL